MLWIWKLAHIVSSRKGGREAETRSLPVSMGAVGLQERRGSGFGFEGHPERNYLLQGERGTYNQRGRTWTLC